jgi:hypothetical protein
VQQQRQHAERLGVVLPDLQRGPQQPLRARKIVILPAAIA